MHRRHRAQHSENDMRHARIEGRSVSNPTHLRRGQACLACAPLCAVCELFFLGAACCIIGMWYCVQATLYKRQRPVAATIDGRN